MTHSILEDKSPYPTNKLEKKKSFFASKSHNSTAKEETKEEVHPSTEEQIAEQKKQRDEAVASSKAQAARDNAEAETLKPLWALAKRMIVDKGFSPESKEAQESKEGSGSLVQEIEQELKEDENLSKAINLLRKKRNFKKATQAVPSFAAFSYDEAFYGCSLLKIAKNEDPRAQQKPSKEQYILKGKELWFWKPDEPQPVELVLKFQNKAAHTKFYKHFDKKLQLSKARDAKKEDLDAIRTALANAELPGYYNAAISPGMLICTNANSKPMKNIDPAGRISLQDIINQALAARGLLKIRLAGHFIINDDGSFQPVLVYHANSGNDKETARYLERLVLDDVIEALLDQGYPNVKVMAQTHQRAYKMNSDKTGLAIEDDHFLWAPEFRSMLNGFSHKVSELSVSQQATLKPRGRFEEEKEGIFVFKGSDGISCPQIEKDGLAGCDANIQTWVASRKAETDPPNGDLLDSMATPHKNNLIDYRRKGDRYSPHAPVSKKNQGLSLHAYSGLSRKGKKAFKRPEESYDIRTALEVVGKEGDRPIYAVKPKVFEAQHNAVMQLYILAANQFLQIDTDKPIPSGFAGKKANSEQIDALKELRRVISIRQKSSEPQPLTPDSYQSMFTDAKSEAINPDWEIEFTTALNKVIKSQTKFDVDVDDQRTNEVALAWESALDFWISHPYFNPFFTQYLKKADENEVPEKQDPLLYRSRMTAQDLRRISSAETQGGGSNPLQMLLSSFNCEMMGGWCSVNGSTVETNQSMANHLSFEEAQLMTEGALSQGNALMAIFDGSNKERSEEELSLEKSSGSNSPSISLPQMINKLFGFLKLCDSLCPDPDLELRPKALDLAPPQEIDRLVAQQGQKVGKTTQIRLKINQVLTELESRHSCNIVKLEDDDSLEILDRPKKSQYIVQNDRIWFWDPNASVKPLLLTCKEEAKAELQKLFFAHKPYKKLKSKGEELASAETSTLKLIKEWTGHRYENEYLNWPHEDKAPYVLFSNLMKELWAVNYFNLKDSDPVRILIEKSVEAALQIHQVKIVYALNQKSSSDEKDDVIDWNGLEKKMSAAKETIKSCTKPMTERKGYDKLKIILLALGGICLAAAGIALLAASFGGLAPLVGIAFTGAAGFGIATGIKFFKTKPDLKVAHFGKQLREDMEGLDTASKMAVGA